MFDIKVASCYSTDRRTLVASNIERCMEAPRKAFQSRSTGTPTIWSQQTQVGGNSKLFITFVIILAQWLSDSESIKAKVSPRQPGNMLFLIDWSVMAA